MFSLTALPPKDEVSAIFRAPHGRDEAQRLYRRLQVTFPPVRSAEMAATIGRLDLSKLVQTNEIFSVQLDSDEPVCENPCPEVMERSFKLQVYDRICSRIMGFLYLGSDTVASSRNTLAAHRISLVINCAGLVCANYFAGDLEYETYNLLDTPGQDIQPLLLATRLTIDQAARQGRRVLVHCHQGVSRSATVVIAYVMARLAIPFQPALAMVRAIRGIVSPNTGFICQLLSWEKRLQRGRAVRESVDDPDAPLVPHSLYRLSPVAVGSGFLPREVPLDVAQLDPRAAFVLWATGTRPQRLIAWIGPLVPARLMGSATEGIRRFATYLRTYEGAHPHELVGCFHRNFYRGGAACTGLPFLEGEFVEARDFCDCDYCAYTRSPGSIAPRFVAEAEIPPEHREQSPMGDGTADWVDFLELIGCTGPVFPSHYGLPFTDAVTEDIRIALGPDAEAELQEAQCLLQQTLVRETAPPAPQSPSYSSTTSPTSTPSPSPRVSFGSFSLPSGPGLSLALPSGLGHVSARSVSESFSDSYSGSSSGGDSPRARLAVFDQSQGWSWLHSFEADDLMPDSAAFLCAPQRNVFALWASGVSNPSHAAALAEYEKSLRASFADITDFLPASVDWASVIQETEELDPDLDPDEEWPEGGDGVLLGIVNEEPDWFCELLDILS